MSVADAVPNTWEGMLISLVDEDVGADVAIEDRSGIANTHERRLRC